MDGFSAIHEIRQKAEFQNMKIICISSKHCVNAADSSRCMVCKVDGSTGKPVTKEALESCLKKLENVYVKIWRR